MMESKGSFGDLLAAFNIDSEDWDIANATYQYDEAAADNGVSADNADQTASDLPEKSETATPESNDQQTANDGAYQNKETKQVKQELEMDNSEKANDNIASQGIEPVTINPEVAPVSVGGLFSVPKVSTLVPPVPHVPSIPMVPQVPSDTVLLPNLPPNSITKTLDSQPQLQPLVQYIQNANLLSNPMLFNSPTVIGTTPLLSQGIFPDLAQQLLNSPAVVNLGAGIQNNVIAVPMTLLPTVINQSAAVTPNSDLPSSGVVTPTGIITPVVTPSPSSSPSPVSTVLPASSELSQRRLSRKGQTSGSAPTVQELLDKRRRNQSPLLSTSSATKSAKYDDTEEMPLTLSGRKRRHTKRYMEYLATKDESEDDQVIPKIKKAALPKVNSPVLDLNKPLTDQLMTISETAAVPSGHNIINVQSTSATSLSPKLDKPTHDDISTSKQPETCDAKNYSSIVIKQEPIESDYFINNCSRSSNINEPISGNKSESKEQNIIAPDGTAIKNEPVENEPVESNQNIQSKTSEHSDDNSDTVTHSKTPQSTSSEKDAKKEADSDKSAEDPEQPLDSKKPIRTREEEERIASEAAARAASQALLRMASKPLPETRKDKETIRKENELRMTKLAEEYQKQQDAQLAMREAAQKAASEAAARAVSLALSRAATEELQPESPNLESLKEAEEAARIASEAATRAAAEAAKRALTEAANKEAENKELPQDLRMLEEKAEEEARRIASEAATRAAAQAAARAATQAAEVNVDLSTSKNPVVVNYIETCQEDLSLIAQQAAVRAVLEAQRRTGNFVPILPATSYTKPTHINQLIKGSVLRGDQQGPVNVVMIGPVVQERQEINKVVTPGKQIITYPKNPSKNLRQSLAWRSFQEGVKQGRYKVVQKSTSEPLNLGLKNNVRQKSSDAHTLNVINHDMRCPYCLIQMKQKSSLIQHISVCLINPQTNDDEYFASHISYETLKFAKKSPSHLCSHCTPNASSLKKSKSWSNVLCRLCVTKCANPKITEKTGDHFITTKSGYFVCKHCGIGLDSEADMNTHLSQNQVKKDQKTKDKVAPDKNSLPVSKILHKKENDDSFQYRCGKCRIMFASVGHLLVHTSHCNLDQYIKVLERLTLYNCFNCPVACKVVPDDGQPHQCKPSAQYSSTLQKTLQAVRDTSTSKESFVCLRCEDIFPSNGHLVLHTKQCNHAQYHLLMRYLDQPPYCNRCLMVFTGYKAYSQHRQWCWKAEREPLIVCDKCRKSVLREEADMMYHDAVCVGLPCTQQRLLFPEVFNSRECCNVISSW